MAENITTPLVSIIMPVYNSENYVVDAIESILKQQYNNWELIIVDDGSTDKSFEVISGYNSPKIKIFQIKNGGAAAARNFGYWQSKGCFVKFFDSDDLISPEMIEEQVKLASQHPNSIISAKWGRFYANDLSDFKISQEDCWQDLSALEWICSSWKYARSMTQPGIFLLPRHIIEKAGLWEANISQLDDTEYFTRTILQAKKVIFSPKSILYYRSGNPSSLSAKHSYAEAESSYQSLLLSISHLLCYKNNKQTRLLAANTLQEFLYKIYPDFKELAKTIALKINALGGSNLSYKTSPLADFLTNFLGWKLVKRLQKFRNA
ncbi:glycosyltransferase family 2 protein [Pedobacter zeae]|uniref:Glycosyl transferase family A n=1 Tax=Pedobacter zeae TaxID=1737356 RepID=A0A7W6KBT6_9SPHI|nr:glycosyltransferase family A protein [Pedobacter zeae]MBB4107795.1 glycosyltransferase involved in cell wall biosynthesis [Pedobacter zeae]GGG97004.1 glycosyl transferase family A [Pedobacter zeae]